MRTVPILLALALCPAVASADERPVWHVDARASWLVLGSRRPTGGIMPTLTFARAIASHEAYDVTLGASLGIAGIGGDAHWIDALTGPVAAVSAHPWTLPLSVGLSLAADVGRLTTCTDWGLCLRYWGLYPAAAAHVAYLPTPHVGTVASCSVRYVDTLGWTGVSVEPTVGVRAAW